MRYFIFIKGVFCQTDMSWNFIHWKKIYSQNTLDKELSEIQQKIGSNWELKGGR